MLLHGIACALIYPFLFAVSEIAQNRTLFLVRVYVSFGCSVVGIVVGVGLLGFAKRYMEAASEFRMLIQFQKFAH